MIILAQLLLCPIAGRSLKMSVTRGVLLNATAEQLEPVFEELCLMPSF